MQYDDAYRKTPDCFGTGPTDILRDFSHLIDKSKPVLDVGCGQGRNTLYLARQCYKIDAIDPSESAVEIINDIVQREKLPVRAYRAGFEDFEATNKCYGAVLLFGIIQILSRDDIRLLVKKTGHWLTDKGLVFITAFTVDDPSYARIASNHEKIGKNSFRTGDSEIATYLEPDEIIRLFKGYSMVHHEEGLGSLHRHGNRPPHRHAHVKAVLSKL